MKIEGNDKALIKYHDIRSLNSHEQQISMQIYLLDLCI